LEQTLSMRDLLSRLDFEEVWGTMTDQEPAYRYDFCNLQMTATQVMSSRLRPIFMFGGVWGDGRSIGEIDFEMPLEVASFEQGVAWISYGIGRKFRPRKLCPWFIQGWEWQDHLPWMQSMKDFEARPQCAVDREWFKIACKKLRELSSSANENDLAIFGFDGEVLRINACSQTIVMPAEGKAWSKQYAIKTQNLDLLPKRLMRTKIHLSVWEDHFSIDRQRWRLAEKTDSILMGSKTIKKGGQLCLLE
jgi:hypothetical protein